ncbi:hypothetical protein QQF64_012812 [Cirrhinus molitorella]|uniref:Uncharacterized protein n=1 Tax=Cirrhinus molitorella TaxID=172907 RepID=A0ABR3LWK2_9TELE
MLLQDVTDVSRILMMSGTDTNTLQVHFKMRLFMQAFVRKAVCITENPVTKPKSSVLSFRCLSVLSSRSKVEPSLICLTRVLHHQSGDYAV